MSWPNDEIFSYLIIVLSKKELLALCVGAIVTTASGRLALVRISSLVWVKYWFVPHGRVWVIYMALSKYIGSSMEWAQEPSGS